MAKPNILLITTDQHNPEILGCAGNPIVRTPNIDRLAGEGVVFESAWTPHPVCTPARTTIFTGQYADRHGVSYNLNIRNDRPAPASHTGLRGEARAFPEVLAGAGYHTSFFGKLHTKQAGSKNFGLQLARLAEGKGQFTDYGAPPDDYRQYLKSKGYSDRDWKTWEIPEYARDGCVTSLLPEEDYIDAWAATEAVNHLQRVAEPFFSWVSFSSPHTPWDPPRPYDGMYSPSEVLLPARRKGELEEKHPQYVDQLARTVPAVPSHSADASLEGGLERAYNRFSDDQTRRMLAAYYGEVTHIDTQVGRILATLDERGFRENTLIVFTADHGDYLGNNWGFYKPCGLFYDSLGRIPLIVNWPGRTEHAARRDDLVSLADLAPTFLEAAGVEPSDPVDGRSLRPLLENPGVDWRNSLWLGGNNVRCVVTSEWKHMRWRDGFEELYNRKDDPHDLHNLAGQKQCQTVKDKLTGLAVRQGPNR